MLLPRRLNYPSLHSLRFFPFQPPSPDLNLKGWWMAIDEVINRGGGGVAMMPEKVRLGGSEGGVNKKTQL